MTSSTRMRLYLISLLLALGAMGLIARYTNPTEQADEAQEVARDYAEIAQEGKLRILAPYTSHTRDESSDSTASLLALSRKLARASGLEVELRLEDNTNQALRLLTLGHVDLIAHPLIRSASIDTMRYRWITETTSGPIYLVQRHDTARLITRQLDLVEQTIHLPKGSSLALFVHHLADEIGGNIHTTEDELYNTEQLIVLVQSGDISLTLCSEDERKRLEGYFPELDFSLPLSHSLRRGWLVRRSSPQLADSLTSWLR